MYFIVSHFYHEPLAREIGQPLPVYLTVNKLHLYTDLGKHWKLRYQRVMKRFQSLSGDQVNFMVTIKILRPPTGLCNFVVFEKFKNIGNTNRWISDIPERLIFSRGETLPCRDKVDDCKEKKISGFWTVNFRVWSNFPQS